MTQPLYIDVFIEIPVRELYDEAAGDKRRMSQGMVDRAKIAADAKCEEAGARLRTDIDPHFIVGQGINARSGEDVVMVSSRWAVDAPAGLAPTTIEEIRDTERRRA